jgi:hypothetical protein
MREHRRDYLRAGQKSGKESCENAIVNVNLQKYEFVN